MLISSSTHQPRSMQPPCVQLHRDAVCVWPYHWQTSSDQLSIIPSCTGHAPNDHVALVQSMVDARRTDSAQLQLGPSQLSWIQSSTSSKAPPAGLLTSIQP